MGSCSGRIESDAQQPITVFIDTRRNLLKHYSPQRRTSMYFKAARDKI
jgi:hypothetical protein